MWRVAVPGALIQSVTSTLVLALLLRFFGWSWISGIILGMGISVASTVVMGLVLVRTPRPARDDRPHRDRMDRGERTS